MEERPQEQPHPSPAEEETASGGSPEAIEPDGPAPAPAEAAVPQEELERLKAELEKKSREAGEYKEKYLRAYAELENFKKRILKDQAEFIRYANEALLRELLVVLDNLERARAHAPSLPEATPWIEGIVLTVKQLEEIMAKFGVTPIQAVGLPFDPSIHQAMLQVERDDQEGTVVEEFQRGYLLHERVLRPALVAVAKKKSKENQCLSAEGSQEG